MIKTANSEKSHSTKYSLLIVFTNIYKGTGQDWIKGDGGGG